MSRLVKGVSRQVIVVKAPDPRFFEQAIFILKEDAFGRGVAVLLLISLVGADILSGHAHHHLSAGRIEHGQPWTVFWP